MSLGGGVMVLVGYWVEGVICAWGSPWESERPRQPASAISVGVLVVVDWRERKYP